jgi:hypothetical protein
MLLITKVDSVAMKITISVIFGAILIVGATRTPFVMTDLEALLNQKY